MSTWLRKGLAGIFCSVVLFQVCTFLFSSGVTGQLSNMDKQASEVSCNCSKGWFLSSILLTLLAVPSIILHVALLCRYRKQKQKGRPLLGEARVREENARVQEEKARVQEEKARVQEEKARVQEEKEQLVREKRFLQAQRQKVDVTLDADTAHPRLEISDDGKSVKDTGTIRKVPSKEKRFDSHTFVLAKEGYTCGRHYWEVDVGKRRSWTLGIAQEPVTRKGTVTLSPKNGFWVIGFADGREYWAHSDPWTRLSVSGKLQKIGIFLDISAKQLSFYNIRKKAVLYTFTLGGDSSPEGKFFPLFSTGPAAAKPDTEPLEIVQGFDDDE